MKNIYSISLDSHRCSSLLQEALTKCCSFLLTIHFCSASPSVFHFEFTFFRLRIHPCQMCAIKSGRKVKGSSYIREVLYIFLDLDLIPKPWRFWKTFQIKRRPALARIGSVWQTSFTTSLRSLLSIVVRFPLSNHITVIFYPPVLFVSHHHL